MRQAAFRTERTDDPDIMDGFTWPRLDDVEGTGIEIELGDDTAGRLVGPAGWGNRTALRVAYCYPCGRFERNVCTAEDQV